MFHARGMNAEHCVSIRVPKQIAGRLKFAQPRRQHVCIPNSTSIIIQHIPRCCVRATILGPPVALLPFLGGGFLFQIDYRKPGTLILTSLLEDLEYVCEARPEPLRVFLSAKPGILVQPSTQTRSLASNTRPVAGTPRLFPGFWRFFFFQLASLKISRGSWRFIFFLRGEGKATGGFGVSSPGPVPAGDQIQGPHGPARMDPSGRKNGLHPLDGLSLLADTRFYIYIYKHS